VDLHDISQKIEEILKNSKTSLSNDFEIYAVQGCLEKCTLLKSYLVKRLTKIQERNTVRTHI